jgi:hypothetical protein
MLFSNNVGGVIKLICNAQIIIVKTGQYEIYHILISGNTVISVKADGRGGINILRKEIIICIIEVCSARLLVIAVPGMASIDVFRPMRIKPSIQ